MSTRQAGQHVLERRANLLSDRIQKRMDDLTSSLHAADGRLPFHTKLSKGDALSWWHAHRYDELGQKVLEVLTPQATLALDAELAKYHRGLQESGAPIEGSSPDGGQDDESSGNT